MSITLDFRDKVQKVKYKDATSDNYFFIYTYKYKLT